MIDLPEYQNIAKKCRFTLRGEAFDVDGFIKAHTQFPHHLLWHKGDQLSNGASLPDCGLISCITDGPLEAWAQEGDLLDFIFDHYIELSSIRTWKCYAEVTVWIYEPQQPLELKPALMGTLAGLGIQLQISVTSKSSG